ncbi:MAG: IS3 family transposase [Planctomycetota bacterium]
MIDEAIEAGAGVQRICAEAGISSRTYQRWCKPENKDDGRRGPTAAPKNKLRDEERRALLSVVNSEEFRDLPPSQIVPRLAERGEYICSEATMYRVLREEKQLAHRGRSKEPQTNLPIERVATKPNQVWSWDITYLKSPVRGRFYYLYMIMDIWSRKVVGWAVHEEESMELAAELARRSAAREEIGFEQLTLHSDNGGPMKGSTMLATLQSLGVVASFTRPRVSDDNAFSEALFKTLKYRPNYPRVQFASIDQARAWVDDFVRWYNWEHRHSGIKFVRPVDRHTGADIDILDRRKATYEQAKARHPERWGTRPTRNWSRPERVVVRARPMVTKQHDLAQAA